MVDIHKMFDAISEQHRQSRSQYHLTLGGLRKHIADMADDGLVVVDDRYGLGEEHSYRGYYSDLSFSDETTPTSVGEVRAMVDRAYANEYEGYKGGDFRYGDDTPLWHAAWGCCGSAIVSAHHVGETLHLVTKNIE